jgi:hypothetical protein
MLKIMIYKLIFELSVLMTQEDVTWLHFDVNMYVRNFSWKCHFQIIQVF